MNGNNEQWKLEGDCTKCRKSDYCSHTCSAHKEHLDSLIAKAFHDVMEEKYPEQAILFNNVIPKAYRGDKY